MLEAIKNRAFNIRQRSQELGFAHAPMEWKKRPVEEQKTYGTNGSCYDDIH